MKVILKRSMRFLFIETVLKSKMRDNIARTKGRKIRKKTKKISPASYHHGLMAIRNSLKLKSKTIK